MHGLPSAWFQQTRGKNYDGLFVYVCNIFSMSLALPGGFPYTPDGPNWVKFVCTFLCVCFEGSRGSSCVGLFVSSSLSLSVCLCVFGERFWSTCFFASVLACLHFWFPSTLLFLVSEAAEAQPLALLLPPPSPLTYPPLPLFVSSQSSFIQPLLAPLPFSVSSPPFFFHPPPAPPLAFVSLPITLFFRFLK